MKRICRQHGISRWLSQQISKVNRSISKLKKVIESVEGPGGAFNLTSIKCHVPVSYCQFNSPSISIPSARKNKGPSSNNKPLGNDVCIGTLQPQQRSLADISRKVDVDKDSDTSEEYCHGSIERQ
jgi:hypothetical protein